MHLWRLILVLILVYTTWAQGQLITDIDNLKDAINNALPGDTIIVKDGTYDTDGSVTISNAGEPQHPIVIRSEMMNGVELIGDSYFDFRQCEHMQLSGFLFTSLNNTVVKLQACHNIRICHNIFRIQETESTKWVIIGGIWNDPNAKSYGNRIDHNLFENKTEPGNFITIDGSSDPVYQSSQSDSIDHNYFRNNNPRAENEKESIRIGWSELSQSSGYTVVEYNLFEDCNGDPEIISVKTCDNVIRFNTFRRCQGTLSLRHGDRSFVYGNFFFGERVQGTGGIRIYGNDHKIYNNYFQDLQGATWDAPLALTNGDYDSGGSLSRHWRINRAEILFNTFVNNVNGIEIGFTNNSKYTKPPRDVTIANNIVVGSENDLIKYYTSPINMIWMGNVMYPTGTAGLGGEFQPDEVKNADPGLEFLDHLWRLSHQSIAIDSAKGTWEYVSVDIDLQTRDTLPDVGADEFSLLSIHNHPLTSNDVGPGNGNVARIFNRFATMPLNNSLYNNYPNPFNAKTMIPYQLNKDGYVSLKIFNVLGREIRTLVQGSQNAGHYQMTWDGTDHLGYLVASGIYIYQIQINNFICVKKMLLEK